MEAWIIGLLIFLICCVLILTVLIWKQNQNQNQYTQDQRENRLRNEWNDKRIRDTFQNISGQIQTVRKEQALGTQSLTRMQEDIQMMNKVMTHTKMRGNWGEYQLEALLKIYAGENPEIFSMQYTLANGKIADAILHVAGTDKVLCIDSKFPMENYLRMEDDPDHADEYSRLFRNNMKKHIDDVRNKYIAKDTLEQAILFIPSEAIYQYICAQCSDTLNYALNNHVLLTSPTTLVGVIFTLLASTRDFYRSQHMDQIETNILKLQEDVARLVERTQKAQKSLESLVGQFSNVNISAHKISKHFDSIIKGREKI